MAKAAKKRSDVRVSIFPGTVSVIAQNGALIFKRDAADATDGHALRSVLRIGNRKLSCLLPGNRKIDLGYGGDNPAALQDFERVGETRVLVVKGHEHSSFESRS